MIESSESAQKSECFVVRQDPECCVWRLTVLEAQHFCLREAIGSVPYHSLDWQMAQRTKYPTICLQDFVY